jgi:hypothetical protein
MSGQGMAVQILHCKYNHRVSYKLSTGKQSALLYESIKDALTFAYAPRPFRSLTRLLGLHDAGGCD